MKEYYKNLPRKLKKKYTIAIKKGAEYPFAVVQKGTRVKVTSK